jgi:2'-5' RNA ligase
MPFSSFPHLRKTARAEANVASRDYPELEEVLVERPPPNSHQAKGVDGLCALCNAEPATQEISGTTVGERCAEHLMGVPGAGTAPPEFGQAIYGSREVVDKLYPKTGGILDWLDRKIGPLAPPQGNRWSFDWCRYRHDSHCFYPSGLDPQATSLAGYAVWSPQDRGTCPRISWESQEACPIGAPGPNSGVSGAAPDAYTLQQPARPRGFLNRLFGSLDQKDPDFRFHFIATWADVRAKANELKTTGCVRIISSPTATNPYTMAEVKSGDRVYQTTILRTLGGRSVAGWECTCAWAHYAWGRSGRWQRFEGRMCSHALATYMTPKKTPEYDKTKEVDEKNKWPEPYRSPLGPSPVIPVTTQTFSPGDPIPEFKPSDKMQRYLETGTSAEKDREGNPIENWRQDISKREPEVLQWMEDYEKRGSLHKLSNFSPERPIAMEVEARLEAGEHPNVVLSYLREAGAPWPEYILTEAMQKPFIARDPADELHTIVHLDGGEAVTDAGERIPAEHLFHPEFDWHSGLEPPAQLQSHAAKIQRDPSPHLNADGSVHSGVMIALVPPDKVRQNLAVEDGETPENMHVTVGYLGKKDSVDPDALHRAVSSFAKEAPPLRGKVSGFGNFEVDPDRNDGYSHAHVGLVDIPGISGFRSKLEEHLGREGLKINDEHGIQPHLTVAYGHEPAEYDQMPDTTDHFDLPHVTVGHGGEWTHYPLEGSPPVPKEGMLRWVAVGGYGDLLAPHWQPSEPAQGRGRGRAHNPDATKFSTYDPNFQKKISTQFHDNVPSELGVNSHKDLVENIKGMYREAKKTNPNAVRAGMSWYRDAHNFNKQLADKHPDGNLRKALGMTAALSPQNHWEENKTQAEYIHHHLSADPDSEDGRFNISTEHAQAAMDKQAEQASVVKGNRQVQQLTPGKRFADMSHEEAAHSLKAQAQYTHQLKVPGRLKNNGEPWSATFANGTGAITKAVRIHRGEDPDDVLQGHKVRSFFNNMADHTNRKKQDDLTIDTHAVSLAAGAKFGASAPEIKTMFANGANKEQNVTGTYGYLADAYRKAHKDLVDSGEMPKTSSPHHLQAVTWTHWRDINDEPGPLKEANKGRFRDYSGENAARLKKFRQERAQSQQVAASIHWAADDTDPDDSGDLLDPTAYDPDAIDPDFDPDLADEAEQAEWDAEPEEMAQRQAERTESDALARRNDHGQLPRISMLHWSSVQDSGISEDVDPGTADAMDEASSVQKAYNDEAEAAQDDWYFNQPNNTKPFADNSANVPTYMSALPHGASMVRWGAEAAEEMLRDEPEGALPSTDGGAPSEDWEAQHSTTAADPISAGPAGFGSPLDPGYSHEDLGYPEADEAVLRPSGGPGAGSFMNKMEDQFTSLDATGSLDPGAGSRAWLLQGDPSRNAGGDQGIRDSDIAAMARRFLDTGELPEGSGPQAKVAAKVFSPAEQQELIQEGSDGTRASNLDRLQLEGTHYQPDEDEELEGLFDA